jgi:predicted DNA-binding protein with PD1-like motif
MHHHRLSGEVERRFLLVFEDGDELVAGLVGFAAEEGVHSAEFTGIGSFADLWLDGGRHPVDSDVRTLDGGLTVVDGVPRVSAYAVVRGEDGTRSAGRMTRGVVRGALKLVLTEDYSGSRARSPSTARRPSPVSERTAS